MRKAAGAIRRPFSCAVGFAPDPPPRDPHRHAVEAARGTPLSARSSCTPSCTRSPADEGGGKARAQRYQATIARLRGPPPPDRAAAVTIRMRSANVRCDVRSRRRPTGSRNDAAPAATPVLHRTTSAGIRVSPAVRIPRRTSPGIWRHHRTSPRRSRVSRSAAPPAPHSSDWRDYPPPARAAPAARSSGAGWGRGFR